MGRGSVILSTNTESQYMVVIAGRDILKTADFAISLLYSPRRLGFSIWYLVYPCTGEEMVHFSVL